MSTTIIKRQFAWYPALMRNKLTTPGPFREQKWVWLKFYTRIIRWDNGINRFRTYDTFLKKIPTEKQQETIDYVSGTPSRVYE